MHTADAKGYSLYELLMTLVSISVVLTLGLPSFGRVVAEHRVRTEVDRLFHAIHLARKISVVQRRVVTICASMDAESCDAAGRWSAGWILFENRDGDQPAVRDTGEPLLQTRRVEPALAIRANRRSFTFRATERRATNGTLTICDRSQRARARQLIVSYTGRPRVARADGGARDLCRD